MIPSQLCDHSLNSNSYTSKYKLLISSGDLLNKVRTKWILLIIGSLFVTGCSDLNLATPIMKQMAFKTKFNAKADDDSFEDDFDTDGPDHLDPPYLGEYVVVSGLNMVTLEGVGLVTGLDGTGGDPPPSQFRTQLLKDMRRRDVEDPNRIISSPSTALVVVRAYLPPLVEPGEKFDVEVRLPDGSETTSLNGGWLLECSLTERAIVAGQGVIEGKERARAKGPILVSTGEGTSNSLLRRGRIVGGGVGLEQRDMYLFMKNEYRSVRNTTRVANRIGTRFFSYDQYGHREPLARPKTDQKIVLQIHPTYKDNFPRYIQVLQNIPFRETEVEQRVRMERLEAELMDPDKAERAALQFEAIGQKSIPMLKKGLSSSNFECRFHAAQALAYLGDASGLEVLYLAARDEPAFRVFAVAAMTGIEDGETFMYLRDLMDESLMETRYGAFRAMTTIDENEPFVKGELLNEQCKLHVLPVSGDPMIHLTHHQKAEIVLFGAEQRFETPMALTAGPHIMVNCAAGSDEVIVSRYRIGEKDQRKVVSTEIAEVIRAAAEMGATYPDLAQLLVQAERQQNLPGTIGIDMLPEAGRYYERPSDPESGDTPKKKRTKVGRENLTPNPFVKVEDEDAETATKPIITTEQLESPDAPPVQTESENEEPKKKELRDPVKFLKTIMKPKTNGEMLYPEQVEE